MTNELNIETRAKAPRRRKIVSLDRRKARMGWLFVLPFLIGFVLIYLPILIDSFKIAFSFTIRHETHNEYRFIGIENFRYALFTDPNFVRVLFSGIGRLALEVPAILLFSLFMAVLLNQKMMGRAAFRAIFFLPVVLATGVMEMTGSLDVGTGGETGTVGGDVATDGSAGGTSSNAGGGTGGGIVSTMDIENLFSNMKVGQQLVGYVVDIINDIYGIVNRSGVQMLIFLAGLQSISPAIYEASRIDGATGWETFWKITFPMISPMILVNSVYTIIDSFTVKNAVMDYINGVNQVSNVELSADGVRTAMALIYFIIIVLILAAVAGIISMFVFYQRKD